MASRRREGEPRPGLGTPALEEGKRKKTNRTGSDPTRLRGTSSTGQDGRGNHTPLPPAAAAPPTLSPAATEDARRMVASTATRGRGTSQGGPPAIARRRLASFRETLLLRGLLTSLEHNSHNVIVTERYRDQVPRFTRPYHGRARRLRSAQFAQAQGPLPAADVERHRRRESRSYAV